MYLHKFLKYKYKYKLIGGKKLTPSEKKKFMEIKSKAKVYAPEKYFTGLSYSERLKRLKKIKKNRYSDSKNPKSYTKWETDFKNGKS